jgi:hypothetical protein
VLLLISDWVRGKTLSGLFTFDKERIKSWLCGARDLCIAGDHTGVLSIEELYFRGTAFNAAELSTYWTEPHQLFTWWKNNVERRSKFKILQDDGAYDGPDARLVSR